MPRFRVMIWSTLAVWAVFFVGCGALAASPTQDPHLASVKVLSTQTHLVDNDVTVVGTVQNGDTGAHDITLRADFFDPNGKAIGSAQGVAEDVAAGATANFEVHGQVDPQQYGTTQVTVVSLSEKK